MFDSEWLYINAVSLYSCRFKIVAQFKNSANIRAKSGTVLEPPNPTAAVKVNEIDFKSFQISKGTYREQQQFLNNVVKNIVSDEKQCKEYKEVLQVV